LKLPGAINVRQTGRELELIGNGNAEGIGRNAARHRPEELRCEALSLEEIFVASKFLVAGVNTMNAALRKEIRLIAAGVDCGV
jgi:hypothetical protein